MMRRFRKLGNAGDTIVEVLIVLAVLGLSMSISYAAANKGLQKSRNAQEHSEAVGIINSQVELLRSAFAKQVGGEIEDETGPFCLSSPTPPASVSVNKIKNSGTGSFNDNLANDTLNVSEYGAACNQNSLYYVSVFPKGNGVYDIRARWEGAGTLGRQQVELTYKIGDVTLGAIGGYVDAQQPALPPFSGGLNVIVKSIPFGGAESISNPARNCGNAGTDKAGTTVTLTGPHQTVSRTTNGSSTAAFTGLQQGDTYNIGVSRTGYGVCPDGTNSAVATTAVPPPSVTKKIYPICTQEGYNNYFTRSSTPATYGFFIFNSLPTGVYFQSYTDDFGVTHTKNDPYYWYAVKMDTFWGLSYFYYIYDAEYHSEPIYNCPS